MIDTLVVFVIVAVAAWYVVRRFVSVGKGKDAGCGCGCSGGKTGCSRAGDGPTAACPENGKKS